MPNAADWLSAGSAAVQAIGAVATIFFSVKLANDAAKREAEAERKSEERARTAEAEATRRAEAAEARADVRSRRHRVEDRIAPLSAAIKMISAAIMAWNNELSRLEGAAQDSIEMANPGPAVDVVAQQLPRLMEQVPDADGMRSMQLAWEALRQTSGGGVGPARTLVAAVSSRIDRACAQLEVLEALAARWASEALD